MSKRSKKFAPWKADGGSFAGGGQGDVFVVRHESGEPAGEFVLKWLKNPKRQARFDQELKSLVAVAGHPNVVKIIDPGAYADGDARYYVMEKGDASLADSAPKNGYPATRAFAIFKDVLAGVKALHDARIIHRDIKPENIILFADVAKVADTGLCLIVDDPRLTPSHEAVGPRFYMAPELEHGRNLDVNFRADFYSLGKLLYWLLSRGVNLPRENFVQDGYALGRTLAPGLEVFNSIFERTLTVRPQSRFSSIDDFISAFDAAVIEYGDHPDTRLAGKLAKARTFRTAFRRLRRDEKEAVIKRAEFGCLHLSVDDLIFVAEQDPYWRSRKLLALLDKKMSPEDERVRPLALTFAQSDRGLDALFHVLGARDLTRAMLEAVVLHGDDDQVTRLANRPASPFIEFDDLIPAVLARLPPPRPLPSGLVGTMAVFPRFSDHPSLVDVMVRVTDVPELDGETVSLAVLALSRSEDPRAIGALDVIVDRVKTRRDELHQLIEPLSLGATGMSKMRKLTSDPALADDDQRLFELALEVLDEALGQKACVEDED